MLYITTVVLYSFFVTGMSLGYSHVSAEIVKRWKKHIQKSLLTFLTKLYFFRQQYIGHKYDTIMVQIIIIIIYHRTTVHIKCIQQGKNSANTNTTVATKSVKVAIPD